jgi:hypothetical protein
MSIRSFNAVPILLAQLLVCVLASGIKAQTTASDPPMDTVLRTELKPCPEPCVLDLISGESASQAFYDLLLTVGVAGGVAELPDNSEQYACAFDPKGRKVTDFLDAIIAAEPRYRWTRSDDVLNLIPVQEPALLGTVISEFTAKDENVWELVAALKQTPDFLAACKKLNMIDRKSLKEVANGFGSIGFGGGRVVKPTTLISLELQHRTVRQILNEIVKRDGIWYYREFSRPDGSVCFDLNISWYYSGPPRKK